MNDIFQKIGLPKSLVWGFFGVLIFMTGELEMTWLSPYLTSNGINAATVFAVYGLVSGISAWLSGVTAETFGVKKTMWLGFTLYVLGVAGFAGLGISQMNYPLILLTYAIKAFGYPLFAYTFVVWITYRVEKATLSSAQGWFWFMFSGGLNVLGACYGIFAKEHFGVIPTLFSAILFATVGAILALCINKSECTNLFAPEEENKTNKFAEFFRGLAIVGREPKVLIGGVIRIINTASQSAFLVFMPIYMAQYGLTNPQWTSIWAIVFIFNMVFNLVFGIVGDKFGWGKTVTWFGSVGCAITVLLFFYSPQICNNYWFILACGALWCITLAGYVPLSALVPSLVDKGKGAAVSVLNLGAGLAMFVGPLIVKMFQTGEASWNFAPIAWTLAGLYIVSAVLTVYISPKKR